MPLPKIEIEITADPTGAEVGINRVTKAQGGLESAARSYQSQLGRLEMAEKSGLVTKSQAAKAIASIEKEYKDASAAAAKYANASIKTTSNTVRYGQAAQTSAAQTANLTSQVNDIGLMLASGQSPLLLAAQQGTQVNQVLSQMGTTGASRVQAIRTAIMAAVSPANLLTFAIIAGGAALGQYAISAFTAEENTDRLKDAVKALSEETENLNLKLTQTRFGLASREEAIAMERIVELKAKQAKLEADIGRALDSSNGRVRATAGARREQLRLVNEELASLEQSLAKNREIRNEIENTVPAASELYQSISNIASANLDGLISQANTLAIQFQNAASAAWEMLEAAQANFNNDLDPFGGAGDFKYSTPSTYRPSRRTSRGGGGGARSSGGGGGAAAVNPLIAELEAVQMALETQSEMYARVYEEQIATLQGALDQRLIAQDLFEELSLKSHQEYMQGMADISQGYHGTMIDQAGQFFGDMAAAFQGGNEKLQRISAAFAATEAAINAWRAYNQVIADPSLPWFAKIPAALSVLTAGFGAVNAIKGIGGSSGGAGGGATSAGGSQAAAAPGNALQVNASFQGDYFSQTQIQGGISDLLTNLQEEARRIGLNLTVTA